MLSRVHNAVGGRRALNICILYVQIYSRKWQFIKRQRKKQRKKSKIRNEKKGE